MNIKIPADFTLAELRAFIEGEAQEAPEGFYLAQEWADHFGIGIALMRKLLNQANERGLMRRMWVRRGTLHGLSCLKPVYALQGKDISDSE
jgi:hypothetical protein